MLINHRRQRCIFFVLFVGIVLLIFQCIHVRKYFLTDEHRIFNSLLIELPHLERIIRIKQANLSSIQSRLVKAEKYLSKYTWHLNRLIKTIDYNKQENKNSYYFNSFDFDFEKNNYNNHSKFLVSFHLINISNDIDYQILNKFYSNIRTIQSPYVTSNRSEAYLNVIYLPIKQYQRNICYKDLIDKNYFVLYEFLNSINDDIDEKCFHGNFLPVKFFTQFDSNKTYVNNDRWRWKNENKTSIGIIFLNTNCKFKN